jgi:hypothetical protein
MRKAPLGDDAPVITHYFTNRTDQKEQLRAILDTPRGEPVPVLAWYGVAGAGKSSLLRHLRELLRTEHPDVPHALWEFREGAFEPERVLTGLRNGLVDWSVDLPGRDFAFPRFDVVRAMLSMQLGELVPEAASAHPAAAVGEVIAALLQLAGEPWAAALVGCLVALLGSTAVRMLPKVRRWLEAGGIREVAKWRLMAPQELSDRLVWAFATDLDELLSKYGRRERFARRAVVFLDQYEKLLAGIGGGGGGAIPTPPPPGRGTRGCGTSWYPTCGPQASRLSSRPKTNSGGQSTVLTPMT